jgi:FkbM family methyltransferase
MLLSLTDLIQKYSLKITGVIHVGAHIGQEIADYRKNNIKNIILIEPCKAAFQLLKNRYSSHHHITLFNCACAATDGEAEMYTETANNGQSNSLLQPIRHLEHYPNIVFTNKETVKVMRLDALTFDRAKYNLLNMDCQGAEGYVIIGGKQTLEHIDYVYTEVNEDAAQLYRNATGITHLDELLKDFQRVETSWTEQGWGDSLYVRKTKLNSL